MSAYNTPVPDVDPVEIAINQLFNQMVFCVNQRRMVVLTEYHYLRDEVASRLQTRLKEEEELIKMKSDTEQDLQMNKFHEFKTETDFPHVAKQGTKGSQIGEFDLPTNLDVSTHGDIVYVTDRNNNRVQILNSSLQHLHSLQNSRLNFLFTSN